MKDEISSKLSVLALSAVAALLVFTVRVDGQEVKQEGPSSPLNQVVALGTTAKLSLQTQLSSKLNEVGDPVTAVLHEPVKDSDGRVAIPKGVEFTGRITQIQSARRPQRPLPRRRAS